MSLRGLACPLDRPGLRWRSSGATTCSISDVSRSAAALIARRCLAWTPNAPSSADQPGHGERVLAVLPAPPAHQAELLELVQPAARRCRPPPAARPWLSIALPGRGPPARAASSAVPSGASSFSLITRSGRYWSRCAVRMYRSR